MCTSRITSKGNPPGLALQIIVVIALLHSGWAVAQSSSPPNPSDSALDSSSAVAPLSAQARVNPQRSASVSVETPGRIKTVHVAEGESFEAGDVLVELACGVEQARLEKTRASQEEAKQIRKANEQLADTRSVGALELALSRVRVQAAKADLAVATAQVEHCFVRAPFDGVVARLHKRQAEHIRVGEPMADLIDATGLEVEFLAPSQWLDWLETGQSFVMHLNELPIELTGTLKGIGVRVDPVSRMVRLKGDLTGNLDKVVPGMSGDVRFEGVQ
jgi:RND family efflux transporter MFP subunit